MDTSVPEEAAAAEDTGAALPVAESAGAGSEEEAKREEDEEKALVARVQKLIARILESQLNPNPRRLHALASILEAQEARYLQQSSNPSLNSARSSHLVGRLGNLVRDNDEFYEAISSKFLTESRYSISVTAASARLLLSCSSSWMYPHVFDDAVLDNIKSWIADDNLRSDSENIWKNELGMDKPTDSELLRTYATGLLSLALAGGGPVIEDILTSGLSAKLMGYLRMRVIGITTSQKDATFPAETKHALAAISSRCREENRGRARQVFDASRLDGTRVVDEGLLDVGDRDRTNGTRPVVDEYWGGGGDLLRSELADSSSEVVGAFEGEDADVAGSGWQNRVAVDGKSKFIERHGGTRSVRDEDVDENVRDELSRRRLNRGLSRSRFKGRPSEGTVEGERPLTSPSSGLQFGGTGLGLRDKNHRNEDIKKAVDASMNSNGLHYDDMVIGEEEDDRLKDCKIGSSDILEMVKRAIRAAEAEARAANAPEEAIKAAGDAAAELVKSAALEAWKSLNDEEAAVLAASQAATTVVDAAVATEVSRNAGDMKDDVVDKKAMETKTEEEMEDFIILDTDSLAKIREKYCIQCLEILGEYVEALGPILHEKGVDVCLVLLQQGVEDGDTPDNLALLPEVLKLICALAAHRKFAALFVDRGGMQKLLSVRRVTQTFFGLSSCLFTIGSLQGIMERVCALPSDVVRQMVELALQLLECPQDQARKNAAIFFAAAFVFRAVLDSFDAQEGLQKMLNLLHGAASVRSGGNSGTLGAPNASLRNERSPAEVLTAAEKQIAYHTCVALRQYFRAHLLLLVDSLRPNKSSRSVARNNPSARAAYKPLDISNEAMDAVFLQIQRDRKIGPAFVRARWPAVDKFLASNGHIILLELCQAPPVERYLHDLGQYALGVLHVITFVPYSRKLIVNATLSNNRIGMAIILDAAANYSYPEVIHPALNVLVNLVCPPPSISNKSSWTTQSQQPASVQALNVSSENRERHSEKIISDRSAPLSVQNEARERNTESQLVERGSAASASTTLPGSTPQTVTPAVSAGVVGDRRISLGPGAGCAGLAAQLEQGYHQAREAVRANNGIKVLLHLLHPRMITPPAALDCIRALACRVLLGLARDDTIAHILTKLQVGKKLSELIRDSGSQASGTEQGRWQSELAQVAIELIAIVTNSGRASTLAATDAAAPTLRRIERAAVAAATPITYHSRELLQLIHEHLQASGFTATAVLLQKEADLTPLPSLGTTPALHQTSVQESSALQLHWPSGCVSCGFLSNTTKIAARDEDAGAKAHLSLSSAKKKPLAFSSSFSHGKSQVSSNSASAMRASGVAKSSITCVESETPFPIQKSLGDSDTTFKTPISLPMKRKLVDFKELPSLSPAKRLAIADAASQSLFGQTPTYNRKNFFQTDISGVSPKPIFGNIPGDNSDDLHYPKTPASQFSVLADTQPGNTERMTLDSLIVQYLKHQHRQCPTPITTLPPLSLFHPHVCPEPSRSLNAPANVTARIATREFRKEFGGIHAHRRDRQFIYSRFRPYRPCRDDSALLTCISFLGDSSRIATGCHSGELKIFDSNSGNVLESQTCHQTPLTTIQSHFSGGNQLVLSSGLYDVKLWDAYSISGGPLHSFEGCKFARFSHSGTKFAALSTDTSRREILLYDVETYGVELRLPESSNGHSSIIRGSAQSLVHFSPSDTMLLWNGILWDRRSSNAVHRFDQFSDFGGGGFHPAGNEVIINSEVWDLRKFKLLRTVPSLDQTVITFNGGGDVIYAILRRNLEDITSAVNTRRVRHPLFPAFRTIDATNYSDIATVQVDRCVLDFATDPTDSFVGVIAMDDHEEMYSSARLYEIGRKRPTDDDSDPDDGGETDEEDEDDDNDESEAEEDPLLGGALDGDEDSDSDDMSNDEVDEDVDSVDELDEDGDFNLDDADLDGGPGYLEFIAQEGDEEDSEIVESLSGSEEEEFEGDDFTF